MVTPETTTASGVRCLAFHSAYACQNTGVCCSSGWPIAVEESIELRIRSRLDRLQTRPAVWAGAFQPMADPPTGCRSRLAIDKASGACTFRDNETRRCVIHRDFGESTLPSACRQFPRVCVLEPDIVSLSLSHYCPTAAGTLFAPPDPIGIADRPESFPSTRSYEGLDARTAYSPFLKPGVLLGFDALRVFEEQAFRHLCSPGVNLRLSMLARVVERIRRWTPSAGPMSNYVFASWAETGGSRVDFDLEDPRTILLSSVPEEADVQRRLPEWTRSKGELDATVDLALRRYLAARLIANWIMFLAEDLRTTVEYLKLCLSTAFLFAGARRQDEPEIDRWKEAIRSADLWLMHHCDPELIAKNCGRVSG